MKNAPFNLARKKIGRSALAFPALLLSVSTARAEIVPDRSLPSPSVVNPIGEQTIIRGGTERGNNLFHSFERFSVPTGGAAVFDNAGNITNIFSRVSGNSPSLIEGAIRANGTANLFLINPNGIVFGPGATVNIGGSFFGTTATYLQFEDGTRYTSGPGAEFTPALTVNRPIGLGFGTGSGSIEVRGPGHSLFVTDPIFSPVFPIPRTLRAGSGSGPGRTLALLARNVTLDGAYLSAGAVEIGSVKEGLVLFSANERGFSLDYSKALDFGDIALSNRSAIDAGGGSIALRGNDISIGGGSILLIQNLGRERTAGDISVEGRNVSLLGTDTGGSGRSSLVNEAIEGGGGNIRVRAENLSLLDGGTITTKTYGNERGGNIEILSRKIEVSGYSSLVPTIFSSVAALTYGSGRSGDVYARGSRIDLLDAGLIGTVTFGDGNGGDVTVLADDLILDGASSRTPNLSALVATTAGRGDAGKIFIEAATVRITGGATVTSSTVSEGNAGDIFIRASSIEVRGGEPVFGNVSHIFSDSTTENTTNNETFRLPQRATGNAGNIAIEAGTLEIGDRAFITVNSSTTGRAGNLTVRADEISLSNFGEIGAGSTFQGQGGNISLQGRNLRLLENGRIGSLGAGIGDGGNINLRFDSILLDKNSVIGTFSRRAGNGGNISIETGTMLLFDNSTISANAVRGAGGNIDIDARAYLASPLSTVSASSQLGLNGAVRIVSPETDPFSSLYPIEARIVEIDRASISSCLEEKGELYLDSSRVVPPSPAEAPGRFLDYEISSPPATGEPYRVPNGIVQTPDGRRLLVHLCGRADQKLNR